MHLKDLESGLVQSNRNRTLCSRYNDFCLETDHFKRKILLPTLPEDWRVHLREGREGLGGPGGCAAAGPMDVGRKAALPVPGNGPRTRGEPPLTPCHL